MPTADSIGSIPLEALDNFLSQIETRAFKMAVIATGNDDEALDIVQDSMMKLVQNYAQKNENEWGALFYTILQSKINDWYRRQKVRNQFRVFSSDDEESPDIIEQAPDLLQKTAGEILNQERAINQLESALHRLPLRQQQAFLLRAWEGMDVAQTAEIMQCSQGSVKTHYSRAVHTLRDMLEEFQ